MSTLCPPWPNHALQRTAAGRSRLQSARLVAAVAELGSFGRLVNLVNSLRSGTLLLVVILLASEKSVGVAAAADGFDNMTVLAIVNGPNEIDLDGDGRKDLVFSARRKN